VKPPDFHSSQFNGIATWDWQATFTNPATGSTTTLNNPTVPADEYRIYAGARSLSGSTAGIGGPGGYGYNTGGNGGFFSQAEIDQINAITDTFVNQVEDREEPFGFSAWGGAITFDRDGSTVWHYNHTTQPAANATDFYSVAVHELTHAFGFGTADEWNALVSGASFFGSAAAAAYGGPVPVNGGHWANNTQSTVYGTATAQEAAMDPDVLNGTRKFFTTLDAAALTDIGWDLVPPAAPSPTGDYNGNGVVDAADYVLWRQQNGTSITAGTGADGSANGSVGLEDYTFWRSKFGLSVGSGSLTGGAVPEPTGCGLVLVGLLGVTIPRSRRKPHA